MKIMIRRRPHAMLTFSAVARLNVRIGTRNVRATISFVKNVAAVASQIAFLPFRLEASWAMWIPRASENASAIATVMIPPMTASLRFVAAFNPIMIPRVVIIPDVRPNDIPVFIDSFIWVYLRRSLLKFMICVCQRLAR